ncbi:MAG: hypothetical protein LBQ12_07095 [Deltaproteobacteria bacterium]|jgi:hypothetical protein|nr:hypothetical protein [Deltaproteobacteria bacterium]
MEKTEVRVLTRDHSELAEIPAKQIIEVASGFVCPKCGKIHYPVKPSGGFLGGLPDDQLLASMLDLATTGHMTRRGIQNYLKYHKRVVISIGNLDESLRPPCP